LVDKRRSGRNRGSGVMARPLGSGSKQRRPRFIRTRRRFGWGWIRQLPLPWMFVFAVCVGMLGYVAESGTFNVRAITAPNLSAKEIAQVTARCDCIGQNIFLVRPNDIKQRLESIPQLVVNRVYTSLPNHLYVEAALKERVAIWRTPEAAYAVASDAEVLQVWKRPFPKTGWKLLPVFDEGYDATVKPGHRLLVGEHVSASALTTALALKSRALPSVRAQVKGYLYQPLSGVILVGRTNWWAVFGTDTSSNLDVRMDDLGAALSRGALAKGSCVDLRIVDAQHNTRLTVSRDHSCV
jgi:hypothetical protein